MKSACFTGFHKALFSIYPTFYPNPLILWKKAAVIKLPPHEMPSLSAPFPAASYLEERVHTDLLS